MASTFRYFLSEMISPLKSVFLTLLFCSLFLFLLGDSPFVIIQAMTQSIATSFGLGYSLFYMTPLLFTGLSAALCFQAGFFNIGGEGQLYLGSLAIIAMSSLFPTSYSFLGVPLGILVSFLSAALLGALVGWLKAKWGTHEVITTILFNFIFISIVNYLILGPFHSPTLQSSETIPISHGYEIPRFSQICSFFGTSCFESTPVNLSLLLGILLCCLATLFLFFTPIGFELRSIGANPTASKFAGIPYNTRVIFCFFLAAGFSGLVGINEVMGNHHSLTEGFSPGYGFIGISVALLAKNHPLGILLSAFLFGVLQNATREMEFISDVATKEMALVFQAVLILLLLLTQRETGQEKRKIITN